MSGAIDKKLDISSIGVGPGNQEETINYVHILAEFGVAHWNFLWPNGLSAALDRAEIRTTKLFRPIAVQF